MLINHLYTKVDLSGMILQVVEDHFVVDLCHSLKATDILAHTWSFNAIRTHRETTQA